MMSEPFGEKETLKSFEITEKIMPFLNGLSSLEIEHVLWQIYKTKEEAINYDPLISFNDRFNKRYHWQKEYMERVKKNKEQKDAETDK